jgi:hypothetical protein
MNLLKIIAELGLDASKYFVGMKRAESSAKSFAKEIKGEFARAFGTVAALKFGRDIINLADDVTDLSDRLGMSTKAIQEWAYAAKKSGSSIESVTRFLEALAVAREKALGGDAASMSAFGELGVSQSDLQSLTLDQLGRKIGSKVRDSSVSDILKPLREVGGKGAAELIPAMKGDIDELAKAAAGVGRIFSDETLESLKALKNTTAEWLDLMTGPLAIGLSKISTVVSYMSEGVKASVVGIGGIIGGLANGLSLKEAWTVGKEMAKEVADEFAAKRKASQDAIDTRNAAANLTPSPSDKLHDASPKKAAEKAAQSSLAALPSLTGWQSAGAAIRFSPDKKELQDIAKHTRETAMNTRPSNKQAGSGIGGLGAELQ